MFPIVYQIKILNLKMMYDKILCFVRRFKERTISLDLRYFLVFLSVRLSSVWLVKTWFVPDEYWQSMEVAHRLVFGYGYLTWEWAEGIRSYLHPLLIAGLYEVLRLLGLDNVSLLVSASCTGHLRCT